MGSGASKAGRWSDQASKDEVERSGIPPPLARPRKTKNTNEKQTQTDADGNGRFGKDTFEDIRKDVSYNPGAHMNHNQQETLDTIEQLESDNKKLQDDVGLLQKELRAREQENENFNYLGKEYMNMQQELVASRDEIEGLQSRLSEYMAIRVTDNNPNIVNLGDRNRPEKLAERFNELYDNQWSDALEVLIEIDGKEEKDAILCLVNIIKVIFEKCDTQATGQLNKTELSIKEMIGSSEFPDHISTHLKTYKEERKKNATSRIPTMRKLIAAELKEQNMFPNKGSIKEFIKEATHICWLMCIQDPAMELDTDCKPGSKVDKTRFGFYMNSGNRVVHIVWPGVRLCKGGPVIHKGVVQGRQRSKRSLGNRTQTGKQICQDVKNGLHMDGMGHANGASDLISGSQEVESDTMEEGLYEIKGSNTGTSQQFVTHQEQSMTKTTSYGSSDMPIDSDWRTSNSVAGTGKQPTTGHSRNMTVDDAQTDFFKVSSLSAKQ